MMTVGSLFSGFGGMDLGLERAGMKVLWQCETNEYARRVLKKNFPGVPCCDDVRRLRSPPRVDLLCGGFPCQDISVAGKGAGIEGSRSGLWKEFARLIGEIQPKWVLIENVPALRSRGLGVVLMDLSALGYDAEWDGLSASAFGAPHRRDRIIVVAYPKRQPVRVEQGRGSGQDGTGAPESGRDGDAGDVADTDVPGLAQRIFQPSRQELPAAERGCVPDHPWTAEPDVGRVAHGVASRVERLRGLGNLALPQMIEHVGRLILGAT